MCYLLFDRMLQLPHMPALGKGFAISFSHDLCHAAGFKYQCSYINIVYASLLRSCLHDKTKHALMQVKACSLYIHFTTLAGVIILLSYNLIMGETCSCKQTSRLTLYRLLWPDPPKDNVALFEGSHIHKAL